MRRPRQVAASTSSLTLAWLVRRSSGAQDENGLVERTEFIDWASAVLLSTDVRAKMLELREGVTIEDDVRANVAEQATKDAQRLHEGHEEANAKAVGDMYAKAKPEKKMQLSWDITLTLAKMRLRARSSVMVASRQLVKQMAKEVRHLAPTPLARPGRDPLLFVHVHRHTSPSTSLQSCEPLSHGRLCTKPSNTSLSCPLPRQRGASARGAVPRCQLKRNDEPVLSRRSSSSGATSAKS